MNPLVVLGLPLFGVAWSIRRWREAKAGRTPAGIPLSWIVGATTLILLFWILRNVPVYPFTLLAP